MDQPSIPIKPIFKGFHHFSGWDLSYPIEDIPETDNLLFGKYLCSVIQTIMSDTLVSFEIRRRLIPSKDIDNPYPEVDEKLYDKQRKGLYGGPHISSSHTEQDLYLIGMIDKERENSLKEITLSCEEILAQEAQITDDTSEEQRSELMKISDAWDRYYSELRNCSLRRFLEPYVLNDELKYAVEGIIEGPEEDLYLDESIDWTKNRIDQGWLNVISLETLLVHTLFVKDERNNIHEWSVSPDVFHAINAFVNRHKMEYQAWRNHKIDFLRQRKYLMCFSKQELYDYPIFFIYDLLGEGEILPVLFDIIGDNSFDRRLRYYIRETMISMGINNMTNLRLLQKNADRYKQINGASLSFWPWYYPDIKEDILAYYKVLRGTASIEDPVVYRFVDLCLPVIVEAVLPTIENANQAVGLILLIQKAKGFDDEWVRSPFAPFMNRMAQILHLDAFRDSMLNVRASNTATRKAAVLLRDKYLALKKYTLAPEGD